MFTGIIKNTAIIEAINTSAAGLKLQISPQTSINPEMGASIAINGICLTVVSKTVQSVSFDISPNTVTKTTVNTWKKGDLLNLEESLKVGDELGGHFVLGHVDDVAEIVSIDKTSESWFIKVLIPAKYKDYLTECGSITIDGISLTTNQLENNIIDLCIIPHTWNVTNIKNWEVGLKVNFEVDYFARNIISFMNRHNDTKNA